MDNLILVDTGPIVALLNRDDEYHEWVLSKLEQVRPPFITCEAVISESAFLLHRQDPGYRNLFGLISSNLIEIRFDLKTHASSVAALLDKYRDTPMSFADSCLVRMSEIHAKSKVFTLDSDFFHYRRNGRQIIPTIHPSR